MREVQSFVLYVTRSSDSEKQCRYQLLHGRGRPCPKIAFVQVPDRGYGKWETVWPMGGWPGMGAVISAEGKLSDSGPLRVTI